MTSRKILVQSMAVQGKLLCKDVVPYVVPVGHRVNHNTANLLFTHLTLKG